MERKINQLNSTAESRSRVCNSLLTGLSLLGIPIFLFLLYRFYEYGWQPVASVYIVAIIVIALGSIFRNRLPLWMRSSICIGTIGFASVSGLYAYGVSAWSVAYVPFAAIFAVLIHNRRSGVLVLLVLTAVVCIFEVLYFSGYLSFAPDIGDVLMKSVERALRLGSLLMLVLATIFAIGMIETDVANTLEQLSEKTLALESSQRQYRGLFENVVDIIYRIDRSGKLVQLSPSVFNLLGFRPEELLGRDTTFFFVNPVDINKIKEQLRETDGTITDHVAIIYNKAGEQQLISSNLKVWKSDSGEVLGVEGVARNITEQRATEEALQRAQKVEALGQLTGGLAHDFNNLLAIVMGNAELLLMRCKEKGADWDALRQILQATEHGAALTQRLLGFARPDTLTPAHTDIDSAIVGLERMFRSALGANISLTFDLRANNTLALVDKNQLEASLLNLVINARDAMPDGGAISISTAMNFSPAQIMTEVDEKSESKFIVIRVADSGLGMPPEVANKAKEPFYTSKPPGTGNGLGLSMVDRFVTESLGRMSIETALGTGTTVSLFVPQIKSEVAGNRIDATEVNETQTEVSETQIEVSKILVVEDSPGLRALVCRMLRSSGYTVLAAEDGELAMSIASNEPDIDLVISDIMLPGTMSGWDVCRDLSKQKNDMRFLLMTGYSDKEQDGIDVPILYKPFRKEELLSRVRRILS